MRISHAVAAALAIAPLATALAQDGASIEDRLRALEARQTQLEQELAERDERIRELETQLKGSGSAPAVAPAPATSPAATVPSVPVSAQPEKADEQWGRYEGGKGIVLARSDSAELDFSVFSYIRYLNQLALDETYTDAFGRTRTLDLRNDIQFQKVTMNFKGWLFDPRFRYLFYAWTSNTSQGQDAQVVLAGNLSYRFNDMLSLAGGIGALPTTRSTNYTFPNWLRVDHRTIADEFFRGSYTTGIWAWGELTEGLKYRVMVGNNLSQLGIDASELDSQMNTFAGALWWMPTTGEYGPGEGLGDYEYHEELATLVGLHFTHSREDAQSQPGLNDFENSQIRLSDGTLIFQNDPFGTGVQINKATYEMAAVNAGFKYRGFSLEGEYYWRWVDSFRATGELPFKDLFDHGFQLQGSAMVIPGQLQAYASGSKIFGEYGDPWDVALGISTGSRCRAASCASTCRACTWWTHRSDTTACRSRRAATAGSSRPT